MFSVSYTKHIHTSRVTLDGTHGRREISHNIRRQRSLREEMTNDVWAHTSIYSKQSTITLRHPVLVFRSFHPGFSLSSFYLSLPTIAYLSLSLSCISHVYNCPSSSKLVTRQRSFSHYLPSLSHCLFLRSVHREVVYHTTLFTGSLYVYVCIILRRYTFD